MPDTLDFLDSHSVPRIENGLVYNFLEPSPTAAFYNTYYAVNSGKTEKPELFEEVKKYHSKLGEGPRRMEEIVSDLEPRFATQGIVIEIGGSMFQNRSANASSRFRNYFPVDISHSSMQAYSQKFGKIAFVCNAQKLPFKDQSIDCIFTHTFLEHPIEPEKVLDEIIRVLKVGGLVIHNDAWFCRWWQRYGIVGLKKFENMSFRERMILIAARLTELPIIRIPPIIISRLWRELFVPKSSKVKLVYKALKPNYTLHLGCDEDAASQLDPIDVIRYYESRGFKVKKPLTLKQRLLHPNTYIKLEKIAV